MCVIVQSVSFTGFFSTAGAVLHWFFLSAQIWWLCHVSTLLYRVVRPSVTMKEKKWIGFMHIILSIFGE